MTGRRVRCTVSEMNYSACGMSVGDWFEVGPEGIGMPDGQPFCFFAVAAALPLVNGRQSDSDIDAWLATEPTLQCPDPPEGLRMRLAAAPSQGSSTR